MRLRKNGRCGSNKMATTAAKTERGLPRGDRTALPRFKKLLSKRPGAAGCRWGIREKGYGRQRPAGEPGEGKQITGRAKAS
ncbi:Hypothetical predicted protein [Pelobates cultripes]|uniref:Uncharacterized protein n=1 Tax=Pelobates cultripes TaxID=61616 RepID=A0AAD1RYY7_PELCU|nr:Hypothetical predicted protein [Pelobates cultripes]